ncbi:AMP-binding protein [Pseudorhodoferax sp.]|uniref:AMP-binding protein n=1 Tax=Pseudorhodoferax sp. TaxID=1993553 RepID=UPI002DD64C65|nr:AMP-binding protein [Pseudorhodoferax sp.]
MQALRPLNIDVAEMTWPALLARQARRQPDKTFLVFEGQRYSYGEVAQRTEQLARGLLRHGVRPGDHVALLIGNCAETLLLNMALGRIGAVTCPVNTAARGDLLAYFLTLCDAQVLVLGQDLAARFAEVQARVPQLTRVVLVNSGPADPQEGPVPTLAGTVVRYEALQEPGAGPALPQVAAHDPQTIMFTSGTTGPSKGILISNAQSFQFSIGRVEYLGLRADDVVYTCLPLFHGNALNAAAVCAFVADATLVLSRRFSARAFWDEVRVHGVTQFNLLSSMTNILWGAPPGAADRAHRVRQCTMVPVPAFAPAFAQRFGVDIVSSYSLTDFGQGCFLQPGAPADKFRSAGRPRPGVDLAILDDAGQPLPTGSAGEICLRSDDPSLGGRSYYKMPQENAKAGAGGWFHTGDRGYLDADGYLFFVDRKKDAIRRRGENVSSWEVEQVIAQHPAVAEVAVYAVGSTQSEDEVMASVVCHAGQSVQPEELLRFCESNLAYFMVPRYLEFVPDLPRTLTEKVQKQALRASAEQRLATLWDREREGFVLRR